MINVQYQFKTWLRLCGWSDTTGQHKLRMTKDQNLSVMSSENP